MLLTEVSIKKKFTVLIKSIKYLFIDVYLCSLVQMKNLKQREQSMSIPLCKRYCVLY